MFYMTLVHQLKHFSGCFHTFTNCTLLIHIFCTSNDLQIVQLTGHVNMRRTYLKTTNNWKETKKVSCFPLMTDDSSQDLSLFSTMRKWGKNLQIFVILSLSCWQQLQKKRKTFEKLRCAQSNAAWIFGSHIEPSSEVLVIQLKRKQPQTRMISWSGSVNWWWWGWKWISDLMELWESGNFTLCYFALKKVNLSETRRWRCV